MKKSIAISTLLTAVILMFSTSLISVPKKPPIAVTGAPGEGTCSDCHSGAGLNMGPGFVTLAFSGSKNEYKLNKNYVITVSVFDTTKSRFGFETVSLDLNNMQAGKPVETDHEHTTRRTDDETGRIYMSNYTGSELNVWTYKWKSPATNIGNVIFYASGNAADWNDNLEGDNIYTTTLQVSPKGVINEDMASEQVTNLSTELSIYPNPVTSGYFNVTFNIKEDKMTTVELYSIRGEHLQTLYRAFKEAGSHDQTVHLMKPVPAGIYLVAVTAGEERTFRKVVFGL